MSFTPPPPYTRENSPMNRKLGGSNTWDCMFCKRGTLLTPANNQTMLLECPAHSPVTTDYIPSTFIYIIHTEIHFNQKAQLSKHLPSISSKKSLLDLRQQAQQQSYQPSNHLMKWLFEIQHRVPKFCLNCCDILNLPFKGIICSGKWYHKVLNLRSLEGVKCANMLVSASHSCPDRED